MTDAFQSASLAYVRIALAFVCSLLLLASPIAEAQHAEMEQTELCDAATGTDDQVVDHQESHDHQHPHHCSSCHFYLVLKEKPPIKNLLVIARVPHAFGMDDLILRPPGKLYRPPKA